MSESWHYVDKFGTSRGPCTIDEMISGYCSGDLFDRTYVWDGVSVKTWTPIISLPSLFDRLERARAHYLAKSNPQMYSVLSPSNKMAANESTEKAKLKSPKKSKKEHIPKQRIPIIADSTTTPTSNEQQIDFPTSPPQILKSNVQPGDSSATATAAVTAATGVITRPNLNKNNTFNVHHNPNVSTRPVVHDNVQTIVPVVQTVSSSRSSDSDKKENIESTAIGSETGHGSKGNEKKKGKKSPRRGKKKALIEDAPNGTKEQNKLTLSEKHSNGNHKKVPVIQVNTLLSVPPPPASTPPATPIEQKYNVPDFATKEKEMRAQKVEFQKVLEEELATIKRELDSKFSEFGSRLERYYKRQCLHVHQHRQVVEWYHTQIQLQGLNQTQSNLMSDVDRDDVSNDKNGIANLKKGPLSYPIATEWDMDMDEVTEKEKEKEEEDDSDEYENPSSLLSNKKRNRAKTETTDKKTNKKVNGKIQSENQQNILEKIREEADIIQNISLEDDFQTLLERIHQIKQSVVDL